MHNQSPIANKDIVGPTWLLLSTTPLHAALLIRYQRLFFKYFVQPSSNFYSLAIQSPLVGRRIICPHFLRHELLWPNMQLPGIIFYSARDRCLALSLTNATYDTVSIVHDTVLLARLFLRLRGLVFALIGVGSW